MYYPKSQIKTNLYANPGEFITRQDNTAYTGYYWATSKGTFYTGKNPNDTPTLELIKATPINTPNLPLKTLVEIASGSTSVDNYLNLRGINLNQLPKVYSPSYSLNIPTSNDYDLGYYTRFFCKKSNQNIYLEINQDTYNDLFNSSPNIDFENYNAFKLIWTLTGEDRLKVSNINRRQVLLLEQQLSLDGFSNYFTNYSQFYQ